MMSTILRNTILTLILTCLTASAALAQTTAFNYQGKLSDSGAAQSSYQMRFELFDAVAGGNQIGGTIADLDSVLRAFSSLMRISQVEATDRKAAFRIVDLGEIAREIAELFDAAAEETGAHLTVVGDQQVLVKGDRDLLFDAAANLVDNAIKYSPLGGPVKVWLRRYPNNEGKATIEICVEDHGIGVPVDAQPRLFERFYRAPNIEGSKTRGIGLGLYIVAQLLKLQGGSIRVESSGIPGEGSRFIFTLPALK